jgi:hypothetical protein
MTDNDKPAIYGEFDWWIVGYLLEADKIVPIHLDVTLILNKIQYISMLPGRMLTYIM